MNWIIKSYFNHFRKLPNDLILTAKAIANNQCLNNRHQIFVDLSNLVNVDAKTGIQRVCKSILMQIIKNPPMGYSVEAIYGANDGNYRYAKSFINKLTGTSDLTNDAKIIEFSSGDIFLGLDLSTHLFPLYSSALDKFRKSGVSIFIVVHDILPILHPEWFTKGTSEAFSHWMSAISQHSDGLLCVSNAVADNVRAWLRNNPPRRIGDIVVDYFHLGADIERSIPANGLPEKAHNALNKWKSSLSFLMVGTIEPRKGHKQVLDALEILWKKDIDVNLIIVGHKGWLTKELTARILKHPELDKRLFWLDGISDEYLLKVYEASSALIAASYAEGFGLPLIEAAQHKLPIIARDIPVFREVAGEHAFYFNNSTEPQVISDAIQKWLKLFKLGKQPKSDDMPRLTWAQSAKMLLGMTLEKTEIKK